MENRELLELAAKAVGLNIIHMPLSGPSIIDGPRMGETWSPLTDDGDALRLAVKLNLWLHVAVHGTSARRAGGAWLGCEARVHGGIEAATRRAIVRAAAAIGKEM